MVICEEAVLFMFPSVIKILERQEERGGLFLSFFSLHDVGFETDFNLIFFSEARLDRVSADAIHTLQNFMGHISERYGKNFYLSRQFLHILANESRAVPLSLSAHRGNPCGGLIGYSDLDTGKLFLQ
jgi:hypothetical protein